MKRKSRFIPILTAVVMTAGLMPVSTFAEEMPDPDAQAIILAEAEDQDDTAISMDETEVQDDTAVSMDGTGEEQQEFEEEFLEANAGEESDGESTEVLNPLDFVTDPSSRSGGGWSWDQDTATLTLKGVWVNLTDYDQDYTAAIVLPDGQATIDVSDINLINCYGTNQGGDRRIGIYCAGDLVIKGKDVLQAYGDKGAAGIRADGSITIEKQGASSDTFQILASGTDYAVSAGKNLTVNDTRLDLRVTGAAGVNAGIYAGNTDAAGTGIEMSGCETHITTYGRSVAGIVTAGGEISLKDSAYFQYLGDQTVTSTGIENRNGDVSIDNSTMEIMLDDNAPDFGKLIAAYADQGNSEASIKISNNSEIFGTSYNKGFVAQNGGIEIGDSNINLRTVNEGLEAGSKSLSVTNSYVSVKSTQGACAANSSGAVSIDNSQVYLEANGENGCALQTDAQVTISNKMSYVDLTGQMAAIEILTAPNVSEMPLTLSDGLAAIEGGTQQHVDAKSGRIFSYSDSTLEMEGDILKGASKQVVFANPSEVIITGQPDDAIVAYPDGAAFEVTLSDPSKAESYQWYVEIPSSHTQTFKLDGPTSNQPRLEVPCTKQSSLAWYFHCEIKTTDGNVLTSRRAVLDMNNRDDDKTVVYACWNAIEPGQSLDLSTAGLGSGTILFDANGTTITFDNVKFDSTGQIWDDRLIPTYGIRIARHLADQPEYELILKGDCSILNTYIQEGGLSGMALDFEFYGTGGLQPLVHIKEDPSGGSLSITSGTYDLRVIGDLDVNADLTLNPAPGTSVHCIDCEGGFNLGSGHTVDLTAKGIALSAMKKISICDGAKLKINMGTPPSSGSTMGTGAIFAGGESLEIGEGAELDITCHITPLDDKRVSGIAGIMLVNGTKMIANGAKITIGMSADPGKTLYAQEFDGIMGADGSDISLDRTELSISIDGTNIGDAAALYMQGNLAMTDCAVSVDATAQASINGIVPEGNLTITDSTVDVNTEYIPFQGSGSSIAIAANIIHIDLEKADHSVRANVKNADGIAMLAKTGKGGDQPKGYDPSYEAKYLHLQGLAKCTTPKKNAISLTSIKGARQPYLYLETYYDLNDTSKPASAVTIEAATDISGAKVKPAKTKYTYTGSAIKPKVTVTLGKTTLKQDRDYTVKYSKNKNVGWATITVTGKGSYTGKAACTFKIVPKGTKLTSVTAGKQKFTAKWKKQATQTTGYQIQYSTSKTFASGNKTVTVKSAKTTGKTIKNLKSKKTYYVRIRTYKKVDGKTYYSAWSAKKSVKTS